MRTQLNPDGEGSDIAGVFLQNALVENRNGSHTHGQMIETADLPDKNQKLLRLATVGMAIVIVIGAIVQFIRLRDISSVMMVNVIHLLMVFFIWRRKSRAVALYFTGLAIYATVMTIRKDASPTA